MDLRDIDLNLLLVFNHLILEKRVATVAEKLGMTQPGVEGGIFSAASFQAKFCLHFLQGTCAGQGQEKDGAERIYRRRAHIP